ncbi:hypothetical protein FIBSPDRAFT_811216 [Athelia psychrophila]|uniref:DUF6534 domain-containing protein n=1 Tax=Athelia psychrophila TaxID=1759441 RepID=A0A166VVM1_9AGAM|nr:hypothetical protein FIBSPDRAFT_811216 [Fibularhizoctonia sp. CBS 109695]
MPPVTLANTIGAAYIGIVFSAILYGLTCLQAYNYYGRFSRDWTVHRVSVGGLVALDTVHLALSIHLGYYYLIENFSNPAALLTIVWSLKAQIAINVVIIGWVQTLYAIRVFKLGKGHHQKIIPALVLIVVAVGYGSGLVLAVFTYQVEAFAKLDNISWCIILSFAVATFGDICVSGAMCYYLQKSRSGFTRTDSKISLLIQYTLCSGLLTSACSMACLITFTLMPNNLVFLAIEFSLTKLYINSFFAMLNARHSINGKSETSEQDISVSLSGLRSGPTHNSYRMNGTKRVVRADESFSSPEANFKDTFTSPESSYKMYPWTIPEDELV